MHVIRCALAALTLLTVGGGSAKDDASDVAAQIRRLKASADRTYNLGKKRLDASKLAAAQGIYRNIWEDLSNQTDYEAFYKWVAYLNRVWIYRSLTAVTYT
jgi:hypothetical protein